jgi:hypothetical protein
MDDVRYRVSAQRNNPRAYRQFFGKDSRVPGIEPRRANEPFSIAFLFAQAVIRWKAVMRL